MISFDLDDLERFEHVALILHALDRLDTISWSKVLVEFYVVLFFDTVFGMLVVIDQSRVIGQQE